MAIGASWGDTQLVCPSILFGEELARQSPPGKRVYAYRLMQVSKNLFGLPQPDWMGVIHGSDVTYLFLPQLLQSDAAQNELSRKMLQAWTNFAKTGSSPADNWTEAVNREAGDFSTRHFHLEAGKFAMVEVPSFKEVCEQFWKPKL